MNNPFVRGCVPATAVSIVALTAIGCTSPSEVHSDIDALFEAAVERGDVVGVVAMAATSDEVIYRGAFGKQNVAEDVEMSLDSIFRIASMTKAVTSVAAMQLVEDGVLQLDSAVSDYVQGFDPQVLEGLDESTGEPMFRPPTSPVTVRHLLTHTSGFGYEIWNPLLLQAVNEGVVPTIMSGDDSVLSSPLVFEPGSQWHYGISTDWLGRLLEVGRGKTLDEVFREQIFVPLNMRDSHYILPASEHPRLVSVFARQQDGSLADVSRPPPDSLSFFSGGGGLMSTADDYLRFLRMLLRGEELDGTRILNVDTVSAMGTNQIVELEAGSMNSVLPELSNDFDFFPESVDLFGLGFLLNGKEQRGRSANSLAWAGLYNTYFWIDPARDTCGVVMTQILPFYDERVV